MSRIMALGFGSTPAGALSRVGPQTFPPRTATTNWKLGLTESADENATTESVPRSAEYEALVLEHLDMLYAVALSLTRNPTEAEDLAQNTLVKALRFHDKFREGTYIKAWLLTILRNTFINEYRRKARRPALVELSGTEVAPETTAERDTPTSPQGSNDNDLLELLEDKVRHAIESLPQDFRQAVIMADLEERSYKEIADLMDCPIGTVMSRLFRGRRLLREQLEGYARERRVVKDPPRKAEHATTEPGEPVRRGRGRPRIAKA